MKRSCFAIKLLMAAMLSLGAFAKSAVVYYGHDVSWPMLGVHDYIILEPGHVPTASHGFKRYRSRIYAYVSVGEVRKDRPWFESFDANWTLGENKTWQSVVADVSNPDYRKFLLDKVVAPLVKEGYKNFFLDTLDSYRLAVKPQNYGPYQEGLVAFIKELKSRYPDAGVILNRGFELLDQVAPLVRAVVVESLFYGLKGDTLDYAEVAKEDRAWLLAQIKRAKSLGLDVIDVEYMPGLKGSEADKVVAKVRAMGVIPYIADKGLHRFGRTVLATIKREILLLYDGRRYGAEYSDLHLYASMPLEYMGYRPVLWDIRRGLPQGHPEDRFAGVLIHLDEPVEDGGKLVRWIRTMAERGLKTVILFDWPFHANAELLGLLGVRTKSVNCSEEGFDIVVDKDHHFEMTPTVGIHTEYFVPTQKGAEPTFAYVDACGNRNVLAAKMSWGGYALGESYMVALGNDTIWTADPFRLFSDYLGLSALPVPDPTTENGRRILFAHIDGDGIMNRAEWNEAYSGAVIRDEIFKRYPIPQTASVIVGEIAPNGLYPDESDALMKVAKSIFALKNVEAATHTFSHPFIWGKIDTDGRLDPRYRLDIPGYGFSLENEIDGSLAFINDRLLPPGKPKAKTVFWTGDCIATKRALAYVYRRNYLNINGGDTYITRDHPWLTYVAPMGICKGPYCQVYAAAQNENVYTNNFTGPFWGFERVIQTFKMTETPRRLKPVNIYYHYYSGSKRAALNALKKVYDWAMKQPLIPLYTSEYIPKVMDFYDVSMARCPSGGWVVAGMDDVRTLRLEGNLLPDDNRSKGLVGYRREKGNTYFAFDGRNRVCLRLGRRPIPGLRESNGRVVAHGKGKTVLKAHVPLRGSWHVPKGCKIRFNPTPDKITGIADGVAFMYRTIKEAVIHVACP